MDIGGQTREEAVSYLTSLVGDVTMVVQYRKEGILILIYYPYLYSAYTPKIASIKAAELKQLTSAPISTQAKPYFIAPMSPARAATEHSGAERNPDMH